MIGFFIQMENVMGKTYQTTIINAPADKVWEKIRDFHDLSWAPNVVTSCISVGDKKGDQIGARRILNDAFHETLVEFSELNKSFQYSIDDGPPPVTKEDVKDYYASVRLIAITDSGTCLIEWSSRWESKGNEAEEFCHNIYLALFADLRKTFS